MFAFRFARLIFAASLGISAYTATAATFIVTDIDAAQPDHEHWGKLDAYNTGNAIITTDAPNTGNGSLKLSGDMTRVQLGYQLGSQRTNFGSVHKVTGLTFDWRVASESSNLDYTPTLRLLVHDGEQLSVYGWNGKYNGVASNPLDNWYSSTTNDLFWQWTYKEGDTLDAGQLKLLPLGNWIEGLSSNAFVTAISVGAGAKAGNGYNAFADNIQLHRGAKIDSYNFEAIAAVPEPATWMMLLIGFFLIAATLRAKNYARPARYDVRARQRPTNIVAVINLAST
ncbi:hypothetical protein GRI38_10725 [Altererythrobacter aurantiacus]|uniref:PEP-CTERM protein-sorting domain-containing protein n=1 Tax=Parapontixanthobacter aurantiacus TaxID=1463599 RepID=A0A844ZFE9_9SPHN|nr:PEP-CTERM sorting domain-containing protein [Parapontixanthobacter aurantiacus]MXO86498.1 hypothetical protein [Parapontixanthobacter aurantiacus]